MFFGGLHNIDLGLKTLMSHDLQQLREQSRQLKEGEKNCEDKNNEIRRSIKVYDASKFLITENEKNIERRIF